MQRIHIALSTEDVAATVEDYSVRLGRKPNLVVAGEYALWRTDTINLSVRKDPTATPGELRHLGWEDPSAGGFTASTDVNGVVWERFTAEQQAQEIEAVWPGSGYTVDD